MSSQARRALILSYNGIAPEWRGPPRHLGANAAILGRASIGSGATLGAGSVIRADGHFVRLGDDVHLSARATVHIAHDLFPAIIGDRVAIGGNAVVHACTVGDDCVIGADCVVLDGSVLATGLALAPGAIVFPKSQLQGGRLYAGMPAKPVRVLAAGELEDLVTQIRAAEASDSGVSPFAPASAHADPSVFIAATARLAGEIRAAADASIWFGCRLDANGGAIGIGARTNIQDNTAIRCSPGGLFEIGADSTIGHNVALADCRIGARSLIGIGSRVAAGTVIEDDVFLAAGAETFTGQILESGWLYGRRPAQKMAPLDDAKRALIAETVTQYCAYARAFKDAERAIPLPLAGRG